MPLQTLATAANSATGLITGASSFELPGVILDLETYEPLLFGIHPRTFRITKSLVAEDHVIPGRHSPLQEPVAGGAEILQLDLLFFGTSVLQLGATKQAIRWLESLLYPDRGGVVGSFDLRNFGRRGPRVCRDDLQANGGRTRTARVGGGASCGLKSSSSASSSLLSLPFC